MTEKEFIKKLFTSIFIVFGLIIAAIVICDPCFHYHGPFSVFSYSLIEKNERYINYGIAKHFEYDAIITGTSMSENFKATEFDELFGVNSIKTCFSGGSHKVVGDYLETTLLENTNVKLVLRSLDMDYIAVDKDYIKTGYDDPQYLYDNNIFNDVNYLLNKDMLLKFNRQYCLAPTVFGEETTSFDEYANWNEGTSFGLEAISRWYTRQEKTEEVRNTDFDMIKENINQNILDVAKDNKDVEFYLFITPYSIMHYDKLNQKGTLEEYLKEIEYVVSLVLEHENVTLFSFLDEYDIVCNIDNYRDLTHYSEEINSVLLQKMNEETSIITQENYEKYFEEITEFYTSYNYDTIFE